MELRNVKHKILTVLKAIPKHCKECGGGKPDSVKKCSFKECKLHPIRFGRRKRGTHTMKSVRGFCLDCMGDQRTLVRECSTEQCWLHPHRMGINAKPKRTRKRTKK